MENLEQNPNIWDVVGQPEEILQGNRKKELRRQAHIQGGALLGYKVIMYVVVYAVMLIFGIMGGVMYVLSGGYVEYTESFTKAITDAMMDSVGWGYLLAVGIGWLVLRIWKKKEFFRYEIYAPGAPMTVGTFLVLVCLVFGMQVPIQLISMGLEFLLNLLGLSLMEVLEANTMDMNHPAMWLYVCLAGPFTEELIFRGFLLRSTEPYGKRFAIFSSAVLFGLFHGNPIQTPFAFLVGLIFGYVAVEYHIIWAMVLHILNNMLLSDLLPRLLSNLPNNMGDTVMWVFLSICLVVGVIMLIVQRGQVRQWIQANKMQAWQHKAYWLSPLMIILGVMCMMDIGLFFLLMLFV